MIAVRPASLCRGIRLAKGLRHFPRQAATLIQTRSEFRAPAPKENWLALEKSDKNSLGIFSFQWELYEIILLSLKNSGTATIISTILGALTAYLLVIFKFTRMFLFVN